MKNILETINNKEEKFLDQSNRFFNIPNKIYAKCGWYDV